MKTVVLMSGKEARLQGYYSLGDFVLEGPESEYDDGLWVWEPGNYAEWYSVDEEFINRLNRQAGI